MGSLSKLIGAAVGSAVGAGMAWIVSKVPALGECAVDSGCTVLGYSQASVTTTITGLFVAGGAALFTYLFPANTPPQ